MYRHRLVFRLACAAVLAVFLQPVKAQLTIEITKGVKTGIPIAVAPFEWKGVEPPPQHVADIVEANLARSGQFEIRPRADFLETPHDHTGTRYKNWRLLKVEALVVGRLGAASPGNFEVRFQLLDVYKEKQLAGYRFVVARSALRKVAHRISDIIYKTMTGNPGAFDTRIAYVAVRENAGGRLYLLMVADSDGHGAREIFSSPRPILSPAWSPDGAHIAYVSFETGRPLVFVHDLPSAKRCKLADFPGLNSAPAWSPDGSRLALTLSRDGNPEVYIMRLSDAWLTHVTDHHAIDACALSSGTEPPLTRVTDHHAIDTEPAWSPDGKTIVFTSDRSGKPQIYRVPVSGGDAERLTFEGDYNARASYGPAGDRLVLVTNQGNGYRIGVFYLENRALQVLTDAELDESPVFAPNGDMILYVAQVGAGSALRTVSSDGRVNQRLHFFEDTVREPAWSSFNQQLQE